MNTKIFGAVIAAGLLLAGAADAQTRKQARECVYVNGVQSCTLTTDYGDYTSKQVCDYPNGSTGNSTCTFERVNNVPARETTGYSKSNEARKEAVRKASGYRDPPGTRDLR